MSTADRLAQYLNWAEPEDSEYEHAFDRWVRNEGWARVFLQARNPLWLFANANKGRRFGVVSWFCKKTGRVESVPAPDFLVMVNREMQFWMDPKTKKQMTFRHMRGGWECGCDLMPRYRLIHDHFTPVVLLFIVIDPSAPQADHDAYARQMADPKRDNPRFEIPTTYPTGVYTADLHEIVGSARTTFNRNTHRRKKCHYVRVIEPDGSLAPGIKKVTTWQQFVDDIEALGLLSNLDELIEAQVQLTKDPEEAA